MRPAIEAGLMLPDKAQIHICNHFSSIFASGAYKTTTLKVAFPLRKATLRDSSLS
jgi:hypothetical protein